MSRSRTDDSQRAGRLRSRSWLAIGVATPLFLIGVHADFVSATGELGIVLGFMVLGVVLTLREMRTGVIEQSAFAKADAAWTWGYVGSMTLVAVVAIVADPVGPPAWFIGLSLVPAVPCVAAAWQIS